MSCSRRHRDLRVVAPTKPVLICRRNGKSSTYWLPYVDAADKSRISRDVSISDKLIDRPNARILLVRGFRRFPVPVYDAIQRAADIARSKP